MSIGPRLPSAGALALLILGVVLLVITGGEDRAGDGDTERGEPQGDRVRALVTRVVDGDTAEMELEGSAGEEDVRYIGVDTPESVTPGQPVECFGKEASEFNEDLVEGRRVSLEFGAERRDRYGRLLAYVYEGETFVNAELVRAGFARTLEIAPNTDFATLLGRLEQQAANAGRGLWSTC